MINIPNKKGEIKFMEERKTKVSMEKIPTQVMEILKTLEDNGYEAYIVGGAVRDYIIGTTPHDYDITTNARPNEIKACFKKTFDTGIEHGTVTALVDGEGYEITTYRGDGKYSDGRHPDTVEFKDNIIDDLARRDLTINAIALDSYGNIVDPFNGQSDIENGIIRCVGNPNDRFKEDALRMLRAVRFEAKLGYTLDFSVMKAIEDNAPLLCNVSAERIREEFSKMLLTPSPKKAFLDAYVSGITREVLPEFDKMMECEQNTPSHYANVGVHSLDTVEKTDMDLTLRWSALLHDVGKPITKTVNNKGFDSFVGHAEKSVEITRDIMNRLKFSNAEKREICNLVKYHDTIITKDSKIRMFSAVHGKPFMDKLYNLQMADSRSHNKDYIQQFIDEKQGFWDKAYKFMEDGSAILPKDLKINGKEVMEYGLKGTEIGDFLSTVYQQCLGQPSLNTNEQLRHLAEKYKQRLDYEKAKAERKQQMKPKANIDLERAFGN